jgi:acetylornithine deacetylase/succinyl-diaminopimelate desuccinylase-like protein
MTHPTPATSAASLRDCVDEAKVTEDINFVAQPRSPGTPHHQAVQDLCKQRFEEAGMTVTVDDYGTGVNVIGVKEGGSKAAERVLISAH